MSQEKPRLTRLMSILLQLQSKRIVTAKELAKKYEVSIRTIYRDIRTLESSGVPVITEESKGYTLMPGYQLPPVMFTEEEANALLIAEKIIQKNKDESLTTQYESVVTKIKAILKYSQKEKIELLSDRIQVRNNAANEKTSDYLIQIQGTITGFQLVKIAYYSLDKKHSERVIEPFALYTTQGNWIVIAFCRLKNDFRAFRLDCIQKLEVLSDHFEPHRMTLQQYFEDCKKKWSNPDIPLTQSTSKFVSNQKNNTMQKVNIEPFHFVGISVRTSNNNGQAAEDISALWQRFMREDIVAKIPNKKGIEVYSLYTDYEGDHNKPYTAVIGCKVENLNNIPQGMFGKSFEGGTYVKTIAKGDLMKGLIVNQWMEIIDMNLDRTYVADFELFGEKAQNPANAEVEFFVGVNS